MKKKSFTPILGDLSRLTETQQQEYVLSACEFLGVPSELGLVGLSYMDVGDGARQLLLYVRRGATDIIRDHRKIDVDSSEEFNGDGYVGWKSKGHDTTGRHEIGIGAVSIKGLGGRAAADAVKTAHTQSLRRMTLQFAGGGFLDESEIHEKTTNIANSVEGLELLPSNTIVTANASLGTPNPNPGKDIITTTQQVEPVKISPFVQQCVSTHDITVDDSPVIVGQTEETPRKRRGRPRKIVNLDSSTILEPNTETPSVSGVVVTTPGSVSVRGQVVVLATNAPPPKEVSAPPSNAEMQVVETPSISSVVKGVESDSEKIAEKPLEKTLEKPSDGLMIPTKEQKTAFLDRLSKYINEILPSGNFLQSEKFGTRNNKMKLFVKAMFPQVNLKLMSVEQWNHLFNFLDSRASNVKDLVQFINTTIGE